MRRLLVLVTICACLASVPSPGQSLTDFATWGTQLRGAVTDFFGPTSTGVSWSSRRDIGNFCDLAFSPLHNGAGNPLYHPLLYPETRCLLRSFLVRGWDDMVAAMDDDPPTATGVRVFYTYASGVIIEAWFDDGMGQLVPFRVAIDFTDMIFFFNEAVNPPPCVPSAAMEARIDAIADRIDVYLITHSHPDHASFRLINAMIARGKPTVSTANAVALIAANGIVDPTILAVPAGTYTLHPQVEMKVHAGAQVTTPNNVYFLNFDVPVNQSSPNDGVTVAHFGDNDDASLAWTVITEIAPWANDHVIFVNYSNYDPVVGQTLISDVRIQSPTYELFHFATPGTVYGMHIPTEANYNPAGRLPLFWGEGFRYPQDMP